MFGSEFITVENMREYGFIFHIVVMLLIFTLSTVRWCNYSIITFFKRHWLSFTFMLMYAIFGLTDLNLLANDIVETFNTNFEVVDKLLRKSYLSTIVYMLTINILLHVTELYHSNKD